LRGKVEELLPEFHHEFVVALEHNRRPNRKGSVTDAIRCVVVLGYINRTTASNLLVSGEKHRAIQILLRMKIQGTAHSIEAPLQGGAHLVQVAVHDHRYIRRSFGMAFTQSFDVCRLALSIHSFLQKEDFVGLNILQRFIALSLSLPRTRILDLSLNIDLWTYTRMLSHHVSRQDDVGPSLNILFSDFTIVTGLSELIARLMVEVNDLGEETNSPQTSTDRVFEAQAILAPDHTLDTWKRSQK